MIKLLVCIPTYERDGIIRDFLEEKLEAYLSFDMHVCCVDSSESNHTESACEGYLGLFPEFQYEKWDSAIHPNVKFIRLLEKRNLSEDYDYIWICQDALSCNYNGIKRIMEKLDEGYDLVHIGNKLLPNCDLKEYVSPEEYFVELGWNATLFGAVILKTSTFIKDVDWDWYEKVCLNEACLLYSQISFIFNRALEIRKFRAIYIDLAEDYIVSKKKTKSGWHDEMFDVYCKDWINAIDLLPNTYPNKDEVIRQLPHKSAIRNEADLISLRLESVYNEKKYQQYRERLQRLLPFSNVLLKRVASGRKDELSRIIWELDEAKLSEIKAFWGENKEIYLYGAGQFGEAILNMLEYHAIRIKGFVVTEKRFDSYLNYPVLEISECKDITDGRLILSVGARYFYELLVSLQTLIGRERIWADLDFNEYAYSRERVFQQGFHYEQ